MNEYPENQIDIDKKILLCWKCGFPNKVGDRYCMYCKSPLCRKLNLISRLELFLTKRKGRQKPNRFITLTIGIILFLTGGYLFAKAIFTNSFTNWLFSLIFLAYGIFSVKFFLTRK